MFFFLSFLGMSLIWWGLLAILIVWVFALPYDIPGQRRRKDSALDTLQKRFALGHITSIEYIKGREIIEHDLTNKKKPSTVRK
jgi:putative membrane protein